MDKAIIDPLVGAFYEKNADQGYADDYDRQHSVRIDWMVKRFGLDKLNNQRVVDVGAGRGNFFKRMDPSNTFVGLDGAKIGSKLVPHLSLRVNLNEPFSHLFDNEGPFDFLICSETIEHISGIDNLMLEMKKLLKPNGLALFSIPDISVTHPVAFVGLFYPWQNFITYIQQYAWLVQEHDTFTAGWQTQCFLVHNAPMAEQIMVFPKLDPKFHGQTPIAQTNL